MEKKKALIFKAFRRWCVIRDLAALLRRSAVLRAPQACSDQKAPPEPSALSGSIPTLFVANKKQWGEPILFHLLVKAV
ncbi:MAG: hypothetical protein IKR93_05065, partial [Firmicutes bacterium]|nr:hypothetical protein [Bacillota bacterium]